MRQCQIFDQNHSEEYVPPIGATYCGACRRAVSVMAAASSAAVWSFQSHACAAGCFFQRLSRASGRQAASTGMGVEPVVSTPMPMTRSAAKPFLALRRPERAAHGGAQPHQVVAGMLPREVRIPGSR